MAQIVLIGVGAGIAAALLFVSLISGTRISLLLAHLTPLPIMIVGLGWSHWSALVASLVAAAAIASLFKGYLFLTFMLGIGLPAWWLSYLALLARPVTTPAGPALEWYPVGRLAIWVAMVSAAIVVALLLTIGQTEEAVRAQIRQAVESMFRLSERAGDGRLPDYSKQIDTFVAIAPAAGAVFVTLLNLFLFWIAAQVVRMSNRLRRPWPDISDMAFPQITPLLLGVAVAGALFTRFLGLVGIAAGVFAASLMIAYAILGFAVLHAITRGMSARGILLGIAYVAVVLVGPALVLIALLGLADTAFDIRGRGNQKRGPPANPT